MQSDSFFEIGVTHEICEDYAVHGNGFAIVSDGCSNGTGPKIDSDWGSRILCKSAEQHLGKLKHSPDLFLTAIGSTALAQLGSFVNLSVDCLTATLMVLHAPENSENCQALVVGDGTIGGQRHDGSWHFINYEYIRGGSLNQSGPFYLRYLMTDKVSEYIENFGGNLKITEYNGNLDEELVGIETIRTLTVDGPVYQNVLFPKKEFKFVFAASDGLTSFYKLVKTATSKHTDAVSLLEVLRVILDIPETDRPEFLRFQRQWAFKRDMTGTFKNKDWKNSDDVSVGGISL